MFPKRNDAVRKPISSDRHVAYDEIGEVSLTSTFVVVGPFAPGEERLVLLKPVVQFSFTYVVSRGILRFSYTLIKSFLIYCEGILRLLLRIKKYKFSNYNFILPSSENYICTNVLEFLKINSAITHNSRLLFNL